jgi:eukaryotic-like serine/threonine-protein kinase
MPRKPAMNRFILVIAAVLTVLAVACPKAYAQTSGDDSDIDWMLVIGIGFGVLVVGGIAFVAIQQSKAKKKSGAATGDEHIVGGYRLRNLMNPGRHSQVWEASELSSLRHFAIKILLPEYAKDREQRRFLFHEAEVGKQLAHPNIIRVVSIGREQRNPHFVMEFFPGGNLKLRILHKEMDFVKEKAADILKQAATALAFINAKGWIHRDFKPENIIVNASGEVRVIDFAIAQRIPSGLARFFHRRKGKVQGTPSYMSPEQIRNEPLDPRTDIYSFGCVAYEIVTGRSPFRASNTRDLLLKHLTEKPASPRMHNPDVTEEFANFVLLMLSKDRKKRPQNFHEVLIELRKIRIFKTDAAKKSPAH